MSPFPGEPPQGTAAGNVADLCQIYADVLGAERVDDREGFFAQGGSSLLVEVLLERVAARLGVHVPVEAFYADPTLAGLRTLVVGPDVPTGPADLPGLLAAAAEPDPERPAVVGPDGVLSYAEVVKLVTGAVTADRGAGELRRLRVATTVAGARNVLEHLARRAPTLLVDPGATAAEEQRAWQLFAGEFEAGSGVLGADAVHGVTTSGSTGRPKVVLSPDDGMVVIRRRQAEGLGIRPGDRYLVTAPLHWGFGLGGGLMTGLLGGATVVLPSLPLTPAGLSATAGQHAVTVTMGVGTAYRFLLAGGAALPALRLAVVSGEPLPAALARQWQERTGVALTDGYGTSETGHVSDNVAGVPGSVGRPLSGVEVRVRGDDGVLVETGVGELFIRSPALANGYAGDPELTAQRFRDGWFRTGDLAEVRADGHLFLRGRLDDQLNVGGTKVDPREVETACREALGLTDCAVIGVPLGPGRTEVCAYVVADRPVTRADLVRALADRLSGYKIPTRVVQLAALPRTPNGKLARTELPQ
ncbi:fatty acid--CoA ligase family protein [Geodermatophilus sp. DF01-2]|uniref:class I adenylate-forming enzyme family protein n=1 Tax=Geodermatophilus sp. DF01-2 TaxID=2559610 RepID=UPI00143221D6|nr:fatty acid--CoA ligase family protein [Geodermatophilus sp. DF01_2]